MDDDILELEDELEETFNQAAEVVQKATTSGKQLNQEIMLQIYGFYKTATIGKCIDPKPGIFDPRGRAKWSAWVNASKLTKEEAMTEYIKLISQHYNWNSQQPTEKRAGGNSSSFGGNAVSSFAVPVEEDDAVDNETTHRTVIFRWIKENNLDKVAQWINEPGNTINFQDQDGLTLLHWAVDRGYLDTAKFLLENKADPSITDFEGQTPLDYAITCEHESLVTLLKSFQSLSTTAK